MRSALALAQPAKPADAILYALRHIGLDYGEASPTGEIGPWRARCPVCRMFTNPDDRPLSITRSGGMHCANGCDVDQVAQILVEAEDRPADSEPPRYPLLTIEDLAELPAPSWLIDDILPTGFNVLFGPSNVGKSFLALDWAMCMAVGLSWHGKIAEPGPVVYIAAEGVAGLHRRVAAWLHERKQLAPDRIRFIPNAPNFLEIGDVQQALATIATMPMPPKLIVIDTMARSMIGGDENASRDVGRFIAGVDELRKPYDAAALVVHHTGKDGEDERGSSALRGAADSMLALKADGVNARLECIKQKDAAPFDPWRLHLDSVQESCIFRSGTNTTTLAPAERQILDEVSAAFGTNYATSIAIMEASGVPKSSYHRSRKALIDRGYLEPEGTERNTRYRLTPEGLTQIVPSGPSESHETSSASPTRPSLYGTVGLETHSETTT